MLIVVYIICRMHSVVVRYYHVHTRSTENVPLLWYKTACKLSGYLFFWNNKSTIKETKKLRVHSFEMIRTRISDPSALGSWYQMNWWIHSGQGFIGSIMIYNHLSDLGSLILIQIISKEHILRWVSFSTPPKEMEETENKANGPFAFLCQTHRFQNKATLKELLRNFLTDEFVEKLV